MDPEASSGPAQAGIQGQVSVIVAEPAWRRLVPGAEAVAARAARAAGSGSAAPGAAPGASPGASIVLAADRTVRRLNARHRGRDKATNVLTYLMPAPEVVLALGVIRREAASAGRRPVHHLAHLVVHGVLHLAGHDHHHAGEARRMELAEARILHRLGVPNPWKRA
jgi:probable rRNA maturation factor